MAFGGGGFGVLDGAGGAAMQATEAHGAAAVPVGCAVGERDVVHRAILHTCATMGAGISIDHKFLVAHSVFQKPWANHLAFYPCKSPCHHIYHRFSRGNILCHLCHSGRGGFEFCCSHGIGIHIKSFHVDVVVGHLHRVGT